MLRPDERVFRFGDLDVGVHCKIDGQPALKFFTKRFILSNHHPSHVTLNLDWKWLKGTTVFSNNEQFYVAAKADEFDDNDALWKIIGEDDPAVVVKLGRRVMNYDDRIWRTKMEQQMLNGLRAKFIQNKNLGAALLATKGLRLIEASVHKFWATGLDFGSKSNEDSTRWLGESRLGSLLERVRRELSGSDFGKRLRASQNSSMQNFDPVTRFILQKCQTRNVKVKIRQGS